MPYKSDGVLTFLVRHAWLGMRAAIEDELEEQGLTVPQFATLMMLGEQPGMSIADVARAVASTRQAANEMIAGLEREGLVSRAPHPTDRRTHQLHLTSLGATRYEASLPAVQRREAALVAGLTPEQRDTVVAWMTSVAVACAAD